MPGDAVALTFDDGPDPRWTPLVLDALGDLGVPATFFLVGGAAEAHPALVRRMVDEGHAVGSHTTSHADLWTLSMAELHREVRAGHRSVEAAAGIRTDRFRPPKGWFDLRVAVAARRCGLRPWLWSIDPTDWEPGTRAEDILERVRPGAGDVVLLHDGMCSPVDPSACDRSATVAAIAALVARVRASGLSFTTIPDGQERR